MKAWTHFIKCKETDAAYGFDYTIKAVKIKGQWRCAERNLSGVNYAQIVTLEFIARSKASFK